MCGNGFGGGGWVAGWPVDRLPEEIGRLPGEQHAAAVQRGAKTNTRAKTELYGSLTKFAGAQYNLLSAV